jgi:hypothetical protein
MPSKSRRANRRANGPTSTGNAGSNSKRLASWRAPGLAAAPTANTYAPRPAIPELPAYIAKAFKTNLRAWQHFQALARTYRRDFVVWIHTARRPETRERRIRESIELLSAGKKLGLK